MKTHSYRHLDTIAALLIALIACLHRLAWSNYPPDVDPINFMVALRTYNISADAPHPPGYPLFVFLGRLSSILVGRQHAYQLVNLALLVGSSYCLYWLFRQLARPRIGLTAAVLLISHPLAWAATTIPESYISDALFSCTILTWIVITRARHLALVIGISLIFFTFGLFRPISCFLLLALATGGAIIITNKSKFKIKLMVFVGALIATISAYSLTVLLAGGLQVYRGATDRVMGSSVRGVSIFAGAPLSAHLSMIVKLVAWGLILTAPAILLVSVCLSLRGRSLLNQPYLDIALKLGLLWIIPPLTFYALVYYLKPTYQLIYLPAFLIVAAWAIQEGLPNLRSKIRWLIVGCIVLAQLLLFFFAPPSLPSQVYTLSHGYLIQQDAAWEKLLKDLRPLHQEKTLLIWIDHPTLTPYALRLIDWPEPVAVANQNLSELTYLLPSTMTWLPSSAENFTISDRYKRVVFISSINRNASIRLVDLDRPEIRQVSNLLRLSQPNMR